MFDDYRYFFYITKEPLATPAEIVLEANDRCQQENHLAQLYSARHVWGTGRGLAVLQAAVASAQLS